MRIHDNEELIMSMNLIHSKSKEMKIKMVIIDSFSSLFLPFTDFKVFVMQVNAAFSIMKRLNEDHSCGVLV